MTDQETPRCELCDLPAVETRVEEDGEVFCCRGCKEVYVTLGEAALEKDDADEDDAPPEDCETAYLHVNGMHCTACEIFVEDAASSHEGVETAAASYATETVRLDYDEDAVDEDELPDAVSGAGYKASHKYDDEARREARNENIGRLIVGGFFGMMAMMWYVFFLYPTYFGYAPLFSLSGIEGYFLFANIFVATTVVFFYTGAPILRGAYVSLRAGQPNMDLSSCSRRSARTLTARSLCVFRQDRPLLRRDRRRRTRRLGRGLLRTQDETPRPRLSRRDNRGPCRRGATRRRHDGLRRRGSRGRPSSRPLG